MELTNLFGELVSKLQGWLEGLILMLPNLVVALLTVLVFVFLARLARTAIRRLMGQVSSYEQVNRLLSTSGYVAVSATGVFIALSILDLDGFVTSLLAGAGIIGLAIGFAFQDIATNFISGILLTLRRPFNVGDMVETNGFTGKVEEITLRSTKLRLFQGPTVIIPNKDVYQSPLTNFNTLGHRRIDLSCGVAYGDDLQKAEDVSLAAIHELDFIDPERPVDFYFNEFGGSSINFVLRFWVAFEAQTDFLRAQSEAIKALKRALDENGLTIPFPITTLDFGVVGGEKLNEVLQPVMRPAKQNNR